MKIEVTNAARQFAAVQYTLSLQVRNRSLVLMDGANEDALASRSCRLGEPLPPTTKGGIAKFAPIDAHEDDWLFPADQHDSLGKEGIGNAFRLP